MKKKRIDLVRAAAVVAVIYAVVYFYLNILSPRLIPPSLRIGIIRKPTNILILGTDITFDAVTHKPLPKVNGRADTILLAHVDPIRSKINILSIPRDTCVSIPKYGLKKINAANAYGGIPLIKQTVSEFLRQKIDYYIKVKPTAVTKLVDILGGVTLDVEKNMRYTDRAQKLNISLKKGRQKLSGKQAHDYIRYRNDFQGDIGRVERQQKFLREVVKSLTKPTNIFKAPFAIRSAFQEIQTDLPPSQLIRLLNFTRMAAVRSSMLSGEVSYIEKVGSVWLPNKAALEKTLEDYF
jgi:LCP family protein required for cell wall assembly